MWEKEIWIAKRKEIITNDYGVDIEYFYTPIKYTINYQPLSGDMSYQEYGEKINDVYRAFVNRYEFTNVINVGDRVYLCDGEISEDKLEELALSDDEYCNKANYVVNVVMPQNFRTKIDFIKRR